MIKLDENTVYPVYGITNNNQIFVIHSEIEDDVTYIEFKPSFGLMIIHKYNPHPSVNISIHMTGLSIKRSEFYKHLDRMRLNIGLDFKINIPRNSYYKI